MAQSFSAHSDGMHNFTGITFATIPGGTFKMGDEIGDLSELCRPVHSVTVSEFEMGVFEITNAQYVQFLNDAIATGDITVTYDIVTGAKGLL